MILVRKPSYRLLSIIGILVTYFAVLVSMTLHSSGLSAQAVEKASDDRAIKIAAQEELKQFQSKRNIEAVSFVEQDQNAPVLVLINNPKPPPPPPPPPPVPAPAPAPVVEPTPAPVAPTVEAKVDKPTKSSKSSKSPKSNKTTKSAQSDDSAPVVPSGNTGDPKQMALTQMVAYGWDDSEFTCLESLWNRESGWDYTAANKSSGAYGIPQSLPGSKMASAGADWKTNPATQIAWGLKYIDGRYGSPCGAWQHSENKGWY
jgi:outer membrane biosynthesis protein TonB